MPEHLLTDWQLDGVALVWPHTGMAAYRECLADLHAFYLAFLRELARHERVLCVVPNAREAERIASATGLTEHALPIAIIEDIWVRDFAPLSAEGSLVQFRYDPEYAETGHSHRVQIKFTACLAKHFGSELVRTNRQIPLVVEGGNLSHDGKGRIVACDKLLARNGLSTTEEAATVLRRDVHVERLALIPVEPDDPIGHADGVARWLPSGHLVINDYASQPGRQYAGYLRKLVGALRNVIEPSKLAPIPYPLPRLGLTDTLDATGNYSNFLLTKNRLYVPAYGLREDDEARSILADLVRRPAVSIDATPLARQGGVLNCATWCFDGSMRPSESVVPD